MRMSRIVNLHEAKTHLSRLVEAVVNGEEIILAKAGKPCCKLVPLDPPTQRPMGFVVARLTEAFFAPLPPDEIAVWE
jgi:prevent-host-death family protein